MPPYVMSTTVLYCIENFVIFVDTQYMTCNPTGLFVFLQWQDYAADLIFLPIHDYTQ